MSLRVGSECTHVFSPALVTTAIVPLVAAVPNQRIYVYRLLLFIGAPAVTIQLQDTTPANLSAPFQPAANGNLLLETQTNGDPWFIGGLGKGLQLVQSGTTGVSFDLWIQQA